MKDRELLQIMTAQDVFTVMLLKNVSLATFQAGRMQFGIIVGHVVSGNSQQVSTWGNSPAVNV